MKRKKRVRETHTTLGYIRESHTSNGFVSVGLPPKFKPGDKVRVTVELMERRKG